MKRAHFSKNDLKSLMRDREVMDEIREKYSGAAFESNLESLVPFESAVSEMTEFPDSNISAGIPSALEAIVKIEGRPVLLIKNDTYVEPGLESLKKRLNPNRENIDLVIPKVARVELLNSPDLSYVGTSWMIDKDIMITNRHVANFFGRKRNNRYYFKLSPAFETYRVQVDFKEEYEHSASSHVYNVIEILHIEEDHHLAPDMALIKIKGENLPPPIQLSDQPAEPDMFVGVIGYPAFDSRNDDEIMNRIFEGIFNVKRLSPGLVSEVKSDAFFTHDCTTLGGNSGSVVFDVSSGKSVGLHYAGRFMEGNYAVSSAIIKARMRDLGPTIVSVQALDLGTAIEEAPSIDDLAGRGGYDRSFLGIDVPLPDMTPELHQQVAPVPSEDNNELRYHHFSVVMHKERKMAIYAVSNIDGNKLFGIRRGSDRWYYDPRMEHEFQAGQDLYSRNNFHRGHLVRRLDPAWGDSREEAKAAIEDTFYWTNCTPQHERFNPRSWLNLEDYILDNAETENIKVSLFTGPVFDDGDIHYREHRIPSEYWKVAVIKNARTGTLSATGYILSQVDFLSDLEFIYGQFRTYQVPLEKIERKTGLKFGLTDFDPLGKIEFATPLVIEGKLDLML